MKKYLSIWLLPCVLAFAVVFGGVAFHANASASEQEQMPSFYHLDPDALWGSTSRIMETQDFEELFQLWLYLTETSDCQCAGPMTPERCQAIRTLLSQEHAPRSAYLSDMDYLVATLGLDPSSDEVVATRWLIENFFHVNDLIFSQFVLEGIIVYNFGFESVWIMPFYNFVNWDLGDYMNTLEAFEEMLQCEFRPQYDFILPETGFVVVLDI
ncbi:MAG: hypothetical protein FWB98_02930 [Defluviitaleaceae bacterium]|nr:hypothetical protein [Defluviitaleaceae bacterium]